MQRGLGIYNPSDWIEEGDGLLESARIVRRSWKRRRASFSRSIESKRATAAVWHALIGMPRASMLLIGYATEMFLKAGLCKALKNCDQVVFDRAIRQFGHKLSGLASEIAVPLSNEHRAYLDQLGELISDARYPIVAEDSATYVAAKNRQTHLIWNDKEFAAMNQLVAKIRRLVALIDADSHNPSFHRRIALERDGYAAFRTGGHLPTRIMFQSQDKGFGVDQLERLITSDPRLFEIQIGWQRASIYSIDQKGRTKLLREPLRT